MPGNAAHRRDDDVRELDETCAYALPHYWSAGSIMKYHPYSLRRQLSLVGGTVRLYFDLEVAREGDSYRASGDGPVELAMSRFRFGGELN
jgi:hypothetical protein